MMMMMMIRQRLHTRIGSGHARHNRYPSRLDVFQQLLLLWRRILVVRSNQQ
jgi:hypothetical protein